MKLIHYLIVGLTLGVVTTLFLLLLLPALVVCGGITVIGWISRPMLERLK